MGAKKLTASLSSGKVCSPRELLGDSKRRLLSSWPLSSSPHTRDHIAQASILKEIIEKMSLTYRNVLPANTN